MYYKNKTITSCFLIFFIIFHVIAADKLMGFLAYDKMVAGLLAGGKEKIKVIEHFFPN
jgi:hypothetical protein